MTASSDWSVPRTERGREIHETAPVAQQDKRFPRRAPPGKRRRQPHAKPGAPDAESPPAEGAGAEATPKHQNTNETASGDEDHVIDTLA